MLDSAPTRIRYNSLQCAFGTNAHSLHNAGLKLLLTRNALNERATSGHPHLPGPSFARAHTTQKDLVKTLVCLEPGHAANHVFRGYKLTITHIFPKIITINYQLPIRALVLNAVE